MYIVWLLPQFRNVRCQGFQSSRCRYFDMLKTWAKHLLAEPARIGFDKSYSSNIAGTMDYRPSKRTNIKGTLDCIHLYFKSTPEQAVKERPVVLFMKGDPAAPRCGFSRAVSQVIAAYEVPGDKLKTYDVLVDPELRQSIKEYSYVTHKNFEHALYDLLNTVIGQLFLNYTSTVSLLVVVTL